MTARINFGIAGACGRGAAFRVACETHGDRVAVRAVCDVNSTALESARQRLGAELGFVDYEEMLDKGGVDAVIVGTPMPFHVPQSIAALNRGIHVLSEVPAGVNIQECMDLAKACRNSAATYMMGENFTYLRTNVVVREMVRRGEFGEVYYAEGEYVHELKKLNEQTRWRRKWQTGIDGVTYPTHSLGPILQWFEGQRVVSVCCAGSGNHFRDPRGDAYENQESCVMLCKMSGGGLVKIRVDMLSERPHNMARYLLQGTRGAYESHRRAGESHLVFLRSRHPDEVMDCESHDFELKDAWETLDAFKDEFLPDWYRNHREIALKAGHGGGDYFEILDFIDVIEGKRPCPVGIHEALDMTLPGLVSQRSILQGGEWLPVPDSRSWNDDTYHEQLMMCWPADREAPEIDMPSGYRMRQYNDSDESAYLQLMHSVGFKFFSQETIRELLAVVLPNAFFVIEHEASGRLVASAMATHHSWPGLPHAGEVSFVGTDPEHRGRRLGRTVSAAVVQRFKEGGYENIYLRTDHWRLPAIKLYLELGFKPWLTDEGVAERWTEVTKAFQCQK